MSTSTQNVIDHIFTTAYTYTNASGFQVQINTTLDGDVTIGNTDTSYNLYLNGLTVSQIVNTAYPPYNWADYPATNTVNLSGNWLASLSGTQKLSVNVCGALVVNDGIDVAVGNIAVASGNFVTASGNIVAHGNIAVDCNANIGGDITAGGTVNALGGSIYNPKYLTVNSNGGVSNYTGSNYSGINYIGIVTLGTLSAKNYLFLSTSANYTSVVGDHVQIKTTNATLTTCLLLVAYTSPTVYSVVGTISDKALHEFVYFGSPLFSWEQLY